MASTDAQIPPLSPSAEVEALTEGTASISVSSTPPTSLPSPSSDAKSSRMTADAASPSSPTCGSPAATSQSSVSSSSNSSLPLRPANTIGSGRGGPPPRISSAGSGASGGPQLATGGPRSIASMNERTQQMAATRLPPSLQARLAAVSVHTPSLGFARKSPSSDSETLSRMPIEARPMDRRTYRLLRDPCLVLHINLVTTSAWTRLPSWVVAVRRALTRLRSRALLAQA